jgi:hypothetical protein
MKMFSRSFYWFLWSILRTPLFSFSARVFAFLMMISSSMAEITFFSDPVELG